MLSPLPSEHWHRQETLCFAFKDLGKVSNRIRCVIAVLHRYVCGLRIITIPTLTLQQIDEATFPGRHLSDCPAKSTLRRSVLRSGVEWG